VKIHDIDTPAILIDIAILEKNLSRMADYCRVHNLALYPHTKTHKIPQIAHLQMKHGAAGITVAKLGEAEVMAAAGLNNIVIVYPLWGVDKWKRLAELAKRASISVAMDSLEVATGISQAAREAGVEIGIRLEFDTGFHRCGLPIDSASMRIGQETLALPNLRWEGISVYPGQIMGNRETRERDIANENAELDRLYALLDTAGLAHLLVSSGNTPAAFESHHFHGVTEIRPGTYVFNDRNTVDAQAADYADCAATVLTTVVSTSVAGKAMVDAGSKTLSADTLLTGDKRNFGYVLDHPELILEDLSEEHGHLALGGVPQVKVGSLVRIVPNHVCPCINLHDRVFVVSGEEVVDRWPISGRGHVV
jgi:D-serine deaminase-like pyridoxal phosphate-dependent protein